MRGLERRLRSALGRHIAYLPAGIASGRRFGTDDIGRVCDTFFAQAPIEGSPWDALRHAHMTLPKWFQHGLDPLSEAYAEQQHRLWQTMSGVERPYLADVDEKEHDWGDVDAVRKPAYFVRRDPLAVIAASDHVIATGMFLKHGGLAPGDWALEYGAGFGQTALALARLGVNVDTVDISTTFCEYVRRQAEFFQVPLTPFHGRFGTNPRPGQRYRLIWFYESFHHCLDFQTVVPLLREHLAAGGRVVLGGEPIEMRENVAVPYPWGLRLHSEVVAVIRKLHWFELGFTEDFLFDLFSAAGFVGWRVDCEPSLFGRLHIFERRPAEIHLGRHWLPTVLAEQWHDADVDGRWTTAQSRLPVDAGADFVAIEIDISNPLWRKRRVEVSYGDKRQTTELIRGQRATVRFNAVAGAREILFRCSSPLPPAIERWKPLDMRSKGIFVRSIRYVAQADGNGDPTQQPAPSTL